MAFNDTVISESTDVLFALLPFVLIVSIFKGLTRMFEGVF